MHDGGKRELIRPITGLRGATILSVILLHFGGFIVALLPSLTEWVHLSRRAVFRMDLFFMLSGFITGYVFIKREERLTFTEYRRFLLGRLIRLYPAYLVAFLALVCGVVIGRLLHLPVHGEYPLAVVPYRLALLQAWPFMSWETWTWNYPTWFLSALWFAYLFVFPCCWFLVRRLQGSRLTFLWVFCPLPLWLIASNINGIREFHMVIRVACEFGAGCGLYVLYASKSRFIAAAQKYLDLTVLGFLVLLLLISTVSSHVAPRLINMALVLGTPLLLAGMTSESSLSARFMATRPMQWLGSISYALFLTHAVAQKFLVALLPAQKYSGSSAPVRYVVVVVYVGTLLGFAFALHKLVEMPCTRVLKQWVARRRAAGDQGLGPAVETGLAKPANKKWHGRLTTTTIPTLPDAG